MQVSTTNSKRRVPNHIGYSPLFTTFAFNDVIHDMSGISPYQEGYVVELPELLNNDVIEIEGLFKIGHASTGVLALLITDIDNYLNIQAPEVSTVASSLNLFYYYVKATISPSSPIGVEDTNFNSSSDFDRAHNVGVYMTRSAASATSPTNCTVHTRYSTTINFNLEDVRALKIGFINTTIGFPESTVQVDYLKLTVYAANSLK